MKRTSLYIRQCTASLLPFPLKKRCNITAPLINQTGLVKGVEIL